MAERGMKKFLPFSSLTEQANFINEMVYEKNKIPKPQISNEQAEKINRILLQNFNKKGGGKGMDENKELEQEFAEEEAF